MVKLLPLSAMALVSFSLALSSCYRVPNQAWTQTHAPLQVANHQSKYMILEVDENGPIFNMDQYQGMKQWLNKDSPDTPVIIFINGWHHNAQSDDSNLLDFKKFLGAIEVASAGNPLAGIYIGWRGDSYDTLLNFEASDFLTIWGRKNAAETVGKHGLNEILTYLKDNHPDRRVFVIGHSLGGAALFNAIKTTLPKEANDGFEYILLNPAVSEKELRRVEQQYQKLQSFQLEASSLATTQLALARAHRKITVLQALGDKPVGFLYRIAYLSTPIGFDKKRTTHKAYTCENANDCTWKKEADCYVALANGKFIIEASPSKGETCLDKNLKPVWVISGADSVSANHNDILNSVQAAALADLIGQRIQWTSAPSATQR